MPQVFVSWSGGKDSCLACYRAVESGLKVGYLLNMAHKDGERSWTHGLPSVALEVQSRAMRIPLLQQRTTAADYEANFKKALIGLKDKGIKGGVFGDIDFEEHRQWIERVCQEVGVTPHLPLWGQDQEKLLRGFIDAGFEAVVVVTKADLLGEEWVGRKLDSNFVTDLSKLKSITPCGEAGEYHTLVTDGPLFKQRIEILEANKVLREGYWFLDILKSELRAKR